jgi:hypothetical protein
VTFKLDHAKFINFKNVTKPKRERIKNIEEKNWVMIENSITIDTPHKKRDNPPINNSAENEHSIKVIVT